MHLWENDVAGVKLRQRFADRAALEAALKENVLPERAEDAGAMLEAYDHALPVEKLAPYVLALEPRVRYVDAELAAHGGAFLTGDAAAPTYADAFVLPIVALCAHYGVELAKYPAAAAWHARLMSRPAFARHTLAMLAVALRSLIHSVTDSRKS